MTVAAVVAFLLGAATIVLYLAGFTLIAGGDRPPLALVIGQSGLMLAAAWGMWRARYWAVLGMQTLLAIVILLFSVLVISASNVLAVAVSVAIIAAAGTLFWHLVKAMARIQMPVRR